MQKAQQSGARQKGDIFVVWVIDPTDLDISKIFVDIDSFRLLYCDVNSYIFCWHFILDSFWDNIYAIHCWGLVIVLTLWVGR